jgi:uncharacterized membrane protein YqjE
MIRMVSSPHSPLAEPGATARVVVESLMHRGELASVELKEARRHGARTAAVLAISCVFLLLGGFTGTVALAAAVWNREDRGLILGLVGLGYVLAAASLGYFASRRLKSWQPFEETRRQFHADCACVHDLFKSVAQ